ncbi:MAG: insulinase family protein [Bdellovibrionaceae bacterium]|nr:insulinase family protein [Pseudobdellovibrionaceae bacterium]
MNSYLIGISFLLSTALISCQTSKKEVITPAAPAPILAKPTSSTALKLKPTKELQLENGLKVYIFRDLSLPRFSVNLLVKVGQKDDSLDKVGVNYLTASLLEQGTSQYSATQIADKIATLGSDLSIAPGEEYTIVSIDGLSMSVDAIVDLFGEVVFKPTFQNEEIAKLKKEFGAQLKKVYDEPSQMADLGLNAFIHKGTPLAFPPIGTEASLKKISKSDIIKNYLTNYRPNNSILSIVGNVSDDVEKKILERFKAWPSRPLKPAVATLKSPADNKKIELQFKKGIVQSEIRVALPMIPRKHPDYLKLRLINEIFGGGFVSRLNSKIRDQLGLTYGISSSLDLGLDSGYMFVSTFTKNETTLQVLEQINSEISKLVNEGITPKELSSAKNMVLAQFPRALETVDRIAFNFMYLDFYGVGPAYLYDFQRSVDKLILEDINQGIKTHFNLDKLKIFVLANPSLEKSLTAIR